MLLTLIAQNPWQHLPGALFIVLPAGGILIGCASGSSLSEYAGGDLWCVSAFMMFGTKPLTYHPGFRRPLDSYGMVFSVTRSLVFFAEGLYSGIRNPAMHTSHEDMDDEEQLAAFSLLARWVDQAVIVRG